MTWHCLVELDCGRQHSKLRSVTCELMGGCFGSPDTKKHTTMRAELGLVAVCSHMQGWRPTQEDEHCWRFGLGPNQSVALFGVFDGHGGNLAAKVAANRIPERVGEQLSRLSEQVCRWTQVALCLRRLM